MCISIYFFPDHYIQQMKFDEYLKKERTRHLEFFLSYMNDEFFFCHLNWSIVNTVQESTHECR